MPSPKGSGSGGNLRTQRRHFKECHNIIGGVDTIIPVDIYVPGCAARPEAIIDGVVKAVALLDKRERTAPRGKRRENTGEAGRRSKMIDGEIRWQGTGKSGYGGPS